jgi:predicted GNAT family acetyltransferase
LTRVLRLERPRDAAEFEAATGAFLLRREAENCAMIGLTSQLALGTAARTAASPYFAVVRAGDEVVGAALIAGFLIVLSDPIDPSSFRLLANDIAREAPAVPGVVGPVEASRAFAEIWTELTGQTHRLNLSERIFRIREVIPPRRVEGAMRIATEAESDLLARWLTAFNEEALGQTPDPGAMDRFATRWIQRQGRTMYLWIDRGQAVSMVGVSGDTPNGIRVAPVYTPPELRGRGYASALTAAATQAQFAAGKLYCFLYTDLANPTSNHIYQAIGYEPVLDVTEYRFGPPSGAA